NHFLHFRAELTVEEFLQVIGVAEQIGGRQYGPGGNLLRKVLRGDIPHFQVSALERNKLRSLLEQVAAVIALENKIVLNSLGKFLHHLRADVLLGEDGGKAQFGLGLRECGKCGRCCSDSGSHEKASTCRLQGHEHSSLAARLQPQIVSCFDWKANVSCAVLPSLSSRTLTVRRQARQTCLTCLPLSLTDRVRNG